jgi:hypothetical protein
MGTKFIPIVEWLIRSISHSCTKTLPYTACHITVTPQLAPPIFTNDFDCTYFGRLPHSEHYRRLVQEHIKERTNKQAPFCLQ